MLMRKKNIMPRRNLEKFLISKGFELDICNCDTKVYRRNINDNQTLYVMIFADANRLVAVDYEDTEYQLKSIMLEKVNTFKKLAMLIDAVI